MIRLPASVFAFVTVLAPLAFAQPKAPSQPKISDDNIKIRGQFQNAKIRFERDKIGHVAFIGGSITEMNGYRPMVMDLLEHRFSGHEVQVYGGWYLVNLLDDRHFRLQEHVLDQGPVDLFLVEFAVNDDQDAGHAHREAMRGMEGIVRHTRTHNPQADIVITYFVNPGMLQKWQANETPLSVGAHEQVADHYRIPTVNLARQVAQSITSGDVTWALFGGTHPKPFGNRIAARMIDRLMTRTWDTESALTAQTHPLPDPIDPNSYFRGRFVDIGTAKLAGGAEIKIPKWKAIGGGFRGRFADRKLLCLEAAQDEAELKFSGTAVGAYVLAGPDAAQVQASVDGSPFKSIDLYHRFSKGLHYPRTVMFATDLEPGDHTLQLRIDASADQRAAWILKFVAN